MFPNNFWYAAGAPGTISNNLLSRIALKRKHDRVLANDQGSLAGAEV